MNKKGQFAIRPVKFTSTEYKGSGGANFLNMDYSLSKLLTQNILYIAYREPITISEIAKSLSTPRSVIEEDIDFLEKNGFMINTSADNYLTNMLLHDFSQEVQEELHKIYTRAAKKVCDKYIPMLCDVATQLNVPQICQFEKEYDFNLFLWSTIAFACSRKYLLLDVDKHIEKFYVTRTDSSHNLAYATVLKDHKHSYLSDLYRSYGDRDFTIGTSEMYPFRVWLYNTCYSNRHDGVISSAYAGFPELYDFMHNRLENDPDKDECMEKLITNGLILPQASNKYRVNTIVIKRSLKEFSDLLPSMPDDLVTLNQELDSQVYELCKSQYPSQMQELFYVFCKNTLNSGGVKTRVLEQLLQKGILKPLIENQKKTVNVIMFLE